MLCSRDNCNISFAFFNHLSRSLTKQKSKRCPILPQPVPTFSNPFTPLVTSPKNGRRTRWEGTGSWSIVDGRWPLKYLFCNHLNANGLAKASAILHQRVS